MGCSPTRLLCPWDSPGGSTGGGRHALLQGIFPTQGSNPRLLCLLRCRRVLSPLIHRGRPAAEKQVIVEGQAPTSSWLEDHGREPAGDSRPARRRGEGGGAPSPSCTSSASPSAGKAMRSLRGRRSPAGSVRGAAVLGGLRAAGGAGRASPCPRAALFCSGLVSGPSCGRLGREEGAEEGFVSGFLCWDSPL